MDEIINIQSNSDSHDESEYDSFDALYETSEEYGFEGETDLETDLYNLMARENNEEVENQIHKCSIGIVIWRILGLIPFIILGFYFGFRAKKECDYGYSWFLIIEAIICSIRLIDQIIYIITRNYQYFIFEKIIYNSLIIMWTISALIYGIITHDCKTNHTSEIFVVFWISIGMSLAYRMMVCIMPAFCCCGIRMHEKYKNNKIMKYIDSFVPLSFVNGTLIDSTGKVIQKLDQDDDKCIICLQNYGETNDLIIKMKCGHHYHKECNIKWLKEQSVCPYCKANVMDK